MPYKSEAQRKKFHALEAEGKISSKTVKKWDKESKGLDLPVRKGKPKSIDELRQIAKKKGV